VPVRKDWGRASFRLSTINSPTINFFSPGPTTRQYPAIPGNTRTTTRFLAVYCRLTVRVLPRIQSNSSYFSFFSTRFNESDRLLCVSSSSRPLAGRLTTPIVALNPLLSNFSSRGTVRHPAPTKKNRSTRSNQTNLWPQGARAKAHRLAPARLTHSPYRIGKLSFSATNIVILPS
jgi:hypothetical protein